MRCRWRLKGLIHDPYPKNNTRHQGTQGDEQLGLSFGLNFVQIVNMGDTSVLWCGRIGGKPEGTGWGFCRPIPYASRYGRNATASARKPVGNPFGWSNGVSDRILLHRFDGCVRPCHWGEGDIHLPQWAHICDAYAGEILRFRENPTLSILCELNYSKNKLKLQDLIVIRWRCDFCL